MIGLLIKVVLLPRTKVCRRLSLPSCKKVLDRGRLSEPFLNVGTRGTDTLKYSLFSLVDFTGRR